MSAVDLAIPYALVGAGGALVLVFLDRRRIGEALLLLVAWPIYGPFVLSRGPGAVDPGDPGTVDTATRVMIEQRLAVARHRATEIARLLARPELCEASARLGRLEQLGAPATVIASMRSRVAAIDRLRALQVRLEREMNEVAAALTELETQAEIVRLAGAEDPTMSDVLRELGARSESLTAMLAEDISWSPSGESSAP